MKPIYILFIVLHIFLLLSCGKSSTTVSFCAVGDVMLARYVEDFCQIKGYDVPFQSSASYISEYDLSFCNLESPLTEYTNDWSEKMFSFSASPIFAEVISNAGFDVISVANNHAYDKGPIGFADTLSNIWNVNMIPVGFIEKDSDRQNPVIVKKNGLTFAFLAYNFFEESLIDYEAYHPSLWNQEYALETVRELDPKVDFIILSFHWGIEETDFITEEQREIAHLLTDAGADLIIGHHPHVISEIEIYNDAVICYSLGNFVFDTLTDKKCESMIFSCDFKSGGVIQNIKLTPMKLNRYFPEQIKTESIADSITVSGAKLKANKYEFIIVNNENGDVFQRPVGIFYNESVNFSVYNDYIFSVAVDNTNVITIPEKYGKIQKTIFFEETNRLRIYLILGKLGSKYGERIAVVPYDLEKHIFKKPFIDLHTNLSPWKLRSSDVDGDGLLELSVGTYKTTVYNPEIDNRMFIYERANDVLYPKWFGSKLRNPYIDYEFIDLDDDGADELIALETNESGVKHIFAYKWIGFGVAYFCTIETNCNNPFLFSYRDGLIFTYER